MGVGNFLHKTMGSRGLSFICAFMLCLGFCNGFAKSYDYNLNGAVEQIITNNDHHIQVEYDVVGRIARIQYSGGKEVAYTYDANDNRLTMTDWQGTTKCVYDPLNRLVSITYPGFKPLLYTYDSQDHITSIQYPNEERVYYQYDCYGHLNSVFSGQEVTSFEYDYSANTVSQMRRSNGMTTDYRYDLSKRITDVIHKNGKGTLLSSYHYEYDANNNYSLIEELSEKGTRTVKYEYDRLDRLVLVQDSNGHFEKYTYDGVGNRTTRETRQRLDTYSYDTHSRLKQVGETMFFYDKSGNLTKKKKGHQITEYAYDENDLLIEVKHDEHLITFEYNGDGKRLSKTVNGVKRYYVNDAVFPMSQVLMETDENHQVLTSYTYADRRLSCIHAQGGFFYLYDHPAKNVAAIVDKTTGSLTSYSYDSFGVAQKSGDSINPFQYAAEQVDEETGLIYLRNRYYDPELGRFITPDHRQGDIMLPQSWNSYVYALNNPMKLADPLGLDWITVVAYPPGTMTHKGKSLTGHSFIILTRANGEQYSLGKYPTPNLFKTKVKRCDQICPGSVMLQWEISPQTYDAIKQDFGQDGFYWLLGNNCCDAVCRVVKKHVGVDLSNTKVAGVTNPTSMMESICAINRESCDYIQKLNAVHDQIGEFLEHRVIDGRDASVMHLFAHFLGIGDRGGVALNKTADLMLELSEIIGATFDENSGQLILMGKRNYSLPQFNPDDFAVAVRSVFGLGTKGVQDPGISIDPILKPHAQMVVRYDGETENTEFGRVMFEADRVLKCLSLGKDNVTGKKIKSHVHGYHHLIERYASSTHPPLGDVYTRLWFAPEEIRVVQSKDQSTMQFENVKMKVLSEATVKNQVIRNRPAEEFAHNITKHYEDYALEFPVLHELKKLGQITGVVKWIKDNQVPFDLTFFKQYQPSYVPTPQTTQMIVIPWSGMKHFVYGGVSYHLDGTNFIQRSSEETGQMKEAALSYRPNDNQFLWEFSNDNSSYIAVAQTLYRTPKVGNLKKHFIDMQIRVEGDFPLLLMRTYNSFEDQESGFGVGWEVAPAALRFPGQKMMWQKGSGYLSILVKDEGREELYEALNFDESGSLIYQSLQGTSILKASPQGGFILTKDNGSQIYFDAGGKIQQTIDRQGICMRYVYNGSHLKCILHESGAEIQLYYVDERIVRADGSNGQIVTYQYNEKQQLISTSEHPYLFDYDDESRLICVKNSSGVDLLKARYDIYGRAKFFQDEQYPIEQQFDLGQRSWTTTDSNNLVTTHLFDESFRLQTVKDSAHRQIEITYDKQSPCPTSITDPLGAMTIFSYDHHHHLTAIQKANGSRKKFWYDKEGRLVITQDGNGIYTLNEYDLLGRLGSRITPCNIIFASDGNITYSYLQEYKITYQYKDHSRHPHLITYPGGKAETRSYNQEGLIDSISFGDGYTLYYQYHPDQKLAKIYDASGFYLELEYAQDKVRSMITPISTIERRQEQNRMIVTDGNGNITSLIYDEWGNLIELVDAEQGSTCYSYNEQNQLTHMTLPDGSVRVFKYDQLYQPVQEASYRG